ncbi:hypothetical protein ACS0TY_031436 [Phlomoides rotata]
MLNDVPVYALKACMRRRAIIVVRVMRCHRICGANDTQNNKKPTSVPLFEPGELTSWSFYHAGIAKFIATFLFLYVTILTVTYVSKSDSKCAIVEIQGLSRAIGGMIFTLVLHRWDLRWAHKSGSDVQAFSGPKIVAGEGRFLYGDVVLRSDLWSRSSERVREQSVYD